MPQIKYFAIEKQVADNSDFVLLQNPVDGITYKITIANLLAGLISGGGSETETDADNLFSDIVLLLSNDGTVLLDKSSLRNSFSNNGIILNNSITKFNANSAYFPGGANILSIPSRNEFNLGVEFTIESFIYPTILDGNPRYIISKVGDLSNNSNRSYGLNVSSNNIEWYFTGNGVNDYPINFSCTLITNTWYHVAISCKDNVLYGFLNGVLLSSIPHTPNYYVGNANLTIGSFGGYAANGYPQLSFNGYIEKNGLRITKKCRYTSTFALSAKAFPTI